MERDEALLTSSAAERLLSLSIPPSKNPTQTDMDLAMMEDHAKAHGILTEELSASLIELRKRFVRSW